MTPSAHTYGVTSSLTQNAFTRTGYSFAGWATTATGGVEYANQALILNLTDVDNGTIILYAIWTLLSGPVYHSVTFVPNNGDESTIVSVMDGQLATPLQPEPTYTRHRFDGWYIDPNSFLLQWNFSNYPVNHDIILYAKWTPTSSILSTETARIAIYPNPTNEQLTIENTQFTINRIEIVDMFGRIVGTYPCSRQVVNVNVSSFAPGVYSVRIKTNNGTVTEKFVKE
jgi:uncharacterized repeat protein (TIGR02543 family)